MYQDHLILLIYISLYSSDYIFYLYSTTKYK
nr:MAG TPA: hypothetical protein [Caudoviricetes sp.]